MTPHYTGIFRSDRRDNRRYRHILSETKAGHLLRLRSGVYATIDAVTSNVIDVERFIPGGILCLYSAWAYYGLSTQVQDAFYIAIERSRKVKLPSFPDVRLVFQSKHLLDIGKTYAQQGDIRFAITDIERSVCDAVKYRHKIGIDVMTEIIDSYLRRPDRNISRLSLYAKKLRIYTTLSNILLVKL